MCEQSRILAARARNLASIHLVHLGSTGVGAHAGLKARLLQDNCCCVGFGRSASDTIGFQSLRLRRGVEDTLPLLASRSRRARIV